MKVRILFDFAGNIYDFYLIWELPFFPSIGNTIEFNAFFERDLIQGFKNTKFIKGQKEKKFEINFLEIINDTYQCRIIALNWMPTLCEIELEHNRYSKESDHWLEVD